MKAAHALSGADETISGSTAASVLGVSFLLAVAWGTSIALTPLFLDDVGFNAAAIGAMGAWFGAGLLVSAPFAGALVRRIGLRWTLALGMILYACATVSLPWLRAPELIAAARFIDGFATLPCTLAAEMALLARPPGRRAFWVSLHGVAVALGLMLGPLCVRFAPTDSFTHRYAFAAALAVAASLSAVFGLRRLDRIGVGRRDGRLTVSQLGALALRLRTPLAAAFTYGAFLGALLLFGPLLVLHDRSASEHTAALLPAIYVLGVCVGSPLASRAADVWGGFRVLVVLALLGAGGVGLMLVREPSWIAIAAVAVMGALLAPVYPVSAALQADLADPSDLGRSNALHAGAYAAGRLVGPLVLGVVLHRHGGNLLLLSLCVAWLILAAATIRRALNDKGHRWSGSEAR